MKSVGVFCGSAAGKNSTYALMTKRLGRYLASEGITAVYGGASVGLMGVLADAALGAGGRVVGVIPKALERREIVHAGLTDLRVVETMHERKAVMGDLSEAFICLPGGLGTMDEFVEVLTWAQLGYHQKPIGLLNSCGYYDHLLQFFDKAVEDGFLWPEHRGFWHIDEDPEKLVKGLDGYKSPTTFKWIHRNEI